MVLKPDQERVKTLLQDTITLLCRNGLNYKSEFNVNALIGITLDKDEVFLVDIRETVKNKGDEESGEDASNDVTASIVEPESPKSPGSGRKKNKKKRNRSQSGLSDAESVTSDSVSGTPNIKQMKPDAEDDDSDDAIIIKDEPGYDQNSYGQQNDILGELSQQGQLYAAPSSLSGTSSWDSPSQQTSQVSQRSIATASLPSSSAPQQHEGRIFIPGKEYRYQCLKCKRKFYSSTGLQDHEMAVHQGIFRYRCPQCSKGFSGSTHLGAHIRRVHSPEGFKCSICLQLFQYITNLKAHMMDIHNENLYDPKFGYKFDTSHLNLSKDSSVDESYEENLLKKKRQSISPAAAKPTTPLSGTTSLFIKEALKNKVMPYSAKMPISSKFIKILPKGHTFLSATTTPAPLCVITKPMSLTALSTPISLGTVVPKSEPIDADSNSQNSIESEPGSTMSLKIINTESKAKSKPAFKGLIGQPQLAAEDSSPDASLDSNTVQRLYEKIGYKFDTGERDTSPDREVIDTMESDLAALEDEDKEDEADATPAPLCVITNPDTNATGEKNTGGKDDEDKEEKSDGDENNGEKSNDDENNGGKSNDDRKEKSSTEEATPKQKGTTLPKRITRSARKGAKDGKEKQKENGTEDEEETVLEVMVETISK